MGPTIDQIEAHIDRTREQLGSNLQELEQRVEAAVDWQQYYRTSPLAFVGAAFVAGALAGMMIPDGRRSSRRFGIAGEHATSLGPRQSSSGDLVLDVWEVMKDAAISLAAARLRDYVEHVVPGFGEHYQRAEQRTVRRRDSFGPGVA